MVSMVSEHDHSLETPTYLLGYSARCGQNYRTPGAQSLSTHFIITPFPTDTPRLLEAGERVHMVCCHTLRMKTAYGEGLSDMMMERLREHALSGALDNERRMHRLSARAGSHSMPTMMRCQCDVRRITP